jgi:hypothetical protein
MANLSDLSADELEDMRLENQRKRDALVDEARALKVAHDVALAREQGDRLAAAGSSAGDAAAGTERA